MTENTTSAPAEAGGAEAVSTAGTVASVLADRRAKREEQPTEEAAAPAAPAEPSTSSAGDQPAEAEGGAETPAAEGDAEGQEPATPAVQPPQYWSKEAKARFADLPPDLQAVVLEQEGGREKATGRAKQEAAEARKAAEKEAGALRESASRLGELLPQLEAAVGSKWDGVTPDVWAEVARTDPARYAVLKAEFDADQAKLAAAKDEHAKAEAARHDEHVTQLVTDLPTVAPELVDPVEGPKRLKEVFSYLGEQGISRDAVKWASAHELNIARKAMLYDRAQAALTSARKDPKPDASPPLKPAASQPGSHTQQRLAGLTSKAAASGRLQDTLAARKARRAAKG